MFPYLRMLWKTRSVVVRLLTIGIVLPAGVGLSLAGKKGLTLNKIENKTIVERKLPGFSVNSSVGDSKYSI